MEWRKRHDVTAGSEISVLVADDHLEIQTVHQSVEEACRMAARYAKKGTSSLDLLREERQKQSARERSLEKPRG